MKIKLLTIVFLLYSISSCKTIIPAIPGIPARDFLFSDKLPIKGFCAYGYILFGSKPITAIEKERMETTINLFLDNFSNFNDGKYGSTNSLMMTYWLLNKPANNYKYVTSKNMYNDYNYDKARIILTSLRKLDKQGPVFVAWEEPFELVSQDSSDVQKCLIVDLSNFTTENLDREVKMWRQMLSEDSNDWGSFSNRVKMFSEETRNLFMSYGKDIVSNTFPSDK